MDGVILAAGQGSRIRSLGRSKPLLPLKDKPLLAHVMRALHGGGVDRFIVVSGYLRDDVEKTAQDIAATLSCEIECIYNEDWDAPNGLSVAAGRSALRGNRFILSMCDHIYTSQLASLMVQAVHDETDENTYLGCDYRLDNPCVDMDDVTRVALEGDRITDIGKGLNAYQAFDSGVFSAHASLIDAILEGKAQNKLGISDGMRRLAQSGHARAIDVQDAFWIDVDDQVAYEKAEALASQWQK